MKALQCKAVLFDLDGVLVDSRRCIERAWERWALGRGMDVKAVLRVANGRRTTETLREIAPHLNLATEVALLERIESEETFGLTAIPGAHALVGTLPPNQWAIVTSGSSKVASTRMRFCRIPTPAVFVTADDVQVGKPAPDGYLKAASDLGVRAHECIVIEDTPPGIEAGRAAGMEVIALVGTYDESVLRGATVVTSALTNICIELTHGTDRTVSIRISQ